LKKGSKIVICIAFFISEAQTMQLSQKDGVMLIIYNSPIEHKTYIVPYINLQFLFLIADVVAASNYFGYSFSYYCNFTDNNYNQSPPINNLNSISSSL